MRWNCLTEIGGLLLDADVGRDRLVCGASVFEEVRGRGVGVWVDSMEVICGVAWAGFLQGRVSASSYVID